MYVNTVTISIDNYNDLIKRSGTLADILGRMDVWATVIEQSSALHFPNGHASLDHVAESMRKLLKQHP